MITYLKLIYEVAQSQSRHRSTNLEPLPLLQETINQAGICAKWYSDRLLSFVRIPPIDHMNGMQKNIKYLMTVRDMR